MDRLSEKVSLVGIIALFSVVAFTNPVSGKVKNDSVIRALKKQGIKYTAERAVLWVEKNYLSNEEIIEFGSLIDKGIINVEKYLGVKI